MELGEQTRRANRAICVESMPSCLRNPYEWLAKRLRRSPRVNHQNAAACTQELKRGRHAGITASNNNDVVLHSAFP
jgi:hypothetical protein